MTLSLIKSHSDFDFVDGVIKTHCLFYYRDVKSHYDEEIHMMLAAFWHW